MGRYLLWTSGAGDEGRRVMHNEDERTYYVVGFRLDATTHYCAWYSDEVDGVVLSPAGGIAAYQTKDELRRVMQSRGISLDAEPPTEYDFDRLETWLAASASQSIDCEFMLNAWNMLTDVAVSLGLTIEEPGTANATYEKLFWGSNIPAVTPEGEHFDPTWTEEDIELLAAILGAGLSILRRALPHARLSPGGAPRE